MSFVQNIIDIIRRKKQKLIINKGHNNLIKVPKNNITKIKIYGNNNKIIIDDDIKYFAGEILIGHSDCETDNCTVTIGGNTSSNGTIIRLMEDNSIVSIGKNCLLADNIYIACSDNHSVLDFDNNLLNEGKSILIEDSVWICRNVNIGKNTKIPQNCVVGIASVVTKKFNEPNCLIAGNPATIRKRNIKWKTLRPKQYKKLLSEKGE